MSLHSDLNQSAQQTGRYQKQLESTITFNVKMLLTAYGYSQSSLAEAMGHAVFTQAAGVAHEAFADDAVVFKYHLMDNLLSLWQIAKRQVVIQRLVQSLLPIYLGLVNCR